MKATLEFELPEDREDLRRATRATDAYLVIWDLDQYLRKLSKYEDKETVNIEELRQFVSELCESRGVNMEDLS